MDKRSKIPGVVRFGIFEANLRTGELHRGGIRVPLQEKPFEVLAALLERPGELVSREQLRRALWPGDAYGDFDDSLNTAVSKLRQALDDRAQAPRFVETLPRRGYRFVAPCAVAETPGFPGSAELPDRAASSLALRRRVLAVGAVAATALLALMVGWWLRGESQRSPRGDRLLGEVRPLSIAVLPFKSLGPDPQADAHLADGMTEEITSRLAKIGRLTVVSRTSVMRYRASELPLPEIGRELHVAHVLEGSVRRSGDEVRIVGKLVEVAGGRLLWAETFERHLDDLFGLQSEVAGEIVAALQLELSPEERTVLGKRPARSFSAYDYYLKGLQYYLRFNEQDNETAIGLFAKAIAEDEGFPLAHAGLADAYYARAMRYGFDRDEWLEAAFREAREAVALDPGLPEAHKALGVAYAGRGLYEESLAALRRAVELEPSYAMAVNNIGAAYDEMGRLDEALPWFERAVTLNPVDSFFYVNVGALYAVLGLDEAAEEWLARALELEPDSVHAFVWLGALRLYRGEDEELLRLARELLERSPEEPDGLAMAGTAHWLMGDDGEAETFFRRSLQAGFLTRGDIALGQILWAQGRRDEADALLEPVLVELEVRVEQGSTWSWDFARMAEIHAVRGDAEEAYRLLDRAAEVGMIAWQLLDRDPCFDGLRQEERFRELLGHIRARVEAMRARVEASNGDDMPR